MCSEQGISQPEIVYAYVNEISQTDPAVLLFDFFSYLNKTKYFIICVFYKCLYVLGVKGEVLVAGAVAAAARFHPALKHCALMLSHSAACGASVKTFIRAGCEHCGTKERGQGSSTHPTAVPEGSMHAAVQAVSFLQTALLFSCCSMKITDF